VGISVGWPWFLVGAVEFGGSGAVLIGVAVNGGLNSRVCGLQDWVVKIGGQLLESVFRNFL